MIDLFSILATHILLAMVALRLTMRPDLDRDPTAEELATELAGGSIEPEAPAHGKMKLRPASHVHTSKEGAGRA